MLESILAIVAALASALALWMNDRKKKAEVSIDLLEHEAKRLRELAANAVIVAAEKENVIRDLEKELAASDPGALFDRTFSVPDPDRN